MDEANKVVYAEALKELSKKISDVDRNLSIFKEMFEYKVMLEPSSLCLEVRNIFLCYGELLTLSKGQAINNRNVKFYIKAKDFLLFYKELIVAEEGYYNFSMEFMEDAARREPKDDKAAYKISEILQLGPFLSSFISDFDKFLSSYDMVSVVKSGNKKEIVDLYPTAILNRHNKDGLLPIIEVIKKQDLGTLNCILNLSYYSELSKIKLDLVDVNGETVLTTIAGYILSNPHYYRSLIETFILYEHEDLIRELYSKVLPLAYGTMAGASLDDPCVERSRAILSRA
jgi:hypothetical protein